MAKYIKNISFVSNDLFKTKMYIVSNSNNRILIDSNIGLFEPFQITNLFGYNKIY